MSNFGESAFGLGVPSESTREDDRDLVLALPIDAVRARRRPTAVVAYYLWEAVLGLLIAWPVAAMVRGAYGQHPRGDAPLWSGGGLELIDLLVRSRDEIDGAMAWSTLTFLIAAFAGIIPCAALFASIAFGSNNGATPSARTIGARAIGAFGPALRISLLAWLVQAIFVGSGFAAFEGFSRAVAQRTNDARGDEIGACIAALFALSALFVGVLADLARASVVRFETTTWRAIDHAVRAFAAAPIHAMWSWSWRSLVAIIPIAIGALVSNRLGGRSGVALVVLMLLHQSIVLARVALRASWFAKALRIVSAHHVATRMR